MIRILLVPFFIIVSLQSYSQVSIGIKAGITANEIVFRGHKDLPLFQDYHLTTSLHAGLFGKVKLRERLNFYPEIQYIEKWSHSNYYDYYYSADGEIRLSYIEFPLVLSYQTFNWVALDFGGSIGFNLGDNTFFQNYSQVDAGILAGPRFDLPKNVSVLLRYYYGLSSIGYYAWDNMTTKPDRLGRSYNQNLQISFAYLF